MILTKSSTARETRRRANADGAPFYHTTRVGQNRATRAA
jgi:hypothetical protein